MSERRWITAFLVTALTFATALTGRNATRAGEKDKVARPADAAAAEDVLSMCRSLWKKATTKDKKKSDDLKSAEFLARARAAELSITKSLGVVKVGATLRMDETYNDFFRDYRNLLKEQKRRDKMIEVAEAFAADLDLQRLVTQKHTKQLLGSVKVFVTTKLKGAKVDGHEVWYVPRAYVNFPSEYRKCNTVSSPATATLRFVANYYMWVRGKGGEKVGQVPVEVGRNAELEGNDLVESFDLSVPE